MLSHRNRLHCMTLFHFSFFGNDICHMFCLLLTIYIRCLAVNYIMNSDEWVLDFFGIRLLFFRFFSPGECFSFCSHICFSCLAHRIYFNVCIYVCLQCVLSHVIPKRALYLWLLFKNVRDNSTKKSNKETVEHWKKNSIEYK